MNIELNSVERGNRAAEWLAGLMLRRDNRILPRFVCIYRELQQRPRRWRRLLRRRLALTLTGAALLLALAGGPVATSVLAEPIDTSANIAVVDGEVAIIDNGQCSLMEAIINAQATQAGQMFNDCKAGKLNGPDTVSLPHGGSFELTADYDNRFGPTGLPVITAAVTIDGHGATIRRSDAAGTPGFRILAVDPDGDLTLRDTTISNGSIFEPYYGGGGIFSRGALTVEGSTITDNYAYLGGGIDAGQATLIDSVISDNEAYYGVITPGGGGIKATTLVIENSTISGNQGGQGGGVFADEATISGSRIVDNVAYEEYGAEGGGIRSGILTLTDSVVAGNTAGGGVDIGGRGGGVHMDSGTISGSTISGNLADVGHDVTSTRDSEPGEGGGVATTGPVTIVNSTISDNEANEGGGLFARGETALTQSTLSGNSARTDTLDSYGHSRTVGGEGGGVLVVAESGTCGALTTRGSLISGNAAAVQGREVFVDSENDCSATVVADAFNVFGCGGSSGLVGFTPGATDVVPSVGLSAILSPLADNGGTTQTNALPPGSPALDIVPDAQCAAAPVNGVDQRGEPRGAHGAGGASANECDAGSFELQSGGVGDGFLVSPARGGAIGDLAFQPADILKYDPAAGWSMYFDGSDVGITKNLSAFEVLDNGDILMSFAGNQRIPGVGTFAPQDIARFVPTATGESTTGSFQWALDGSDNLLTAAGERIDALADTGDGRWAISTTGTASVRLPDGTPLKAQDEDALGLEPDTGRWSAFFDGTAVPGLRAEDVNAMWIDPATGDIYIGLLSAFNLGGVGTPGVQGNGRDIVKLTPSGAPGGYTPSLWWDGSAAGFPVNIDGLEILR